VEKVRKKRKLYLPPPPRGKVPLHKEWWRASSDTLWDPCQPACSNRAKCWSQTLEIGSVKWKGRFEIFGVRKFPHSQEESELRQRSATQPLGSVEQGGLQPSCSSTNDCAPPGGVAVTVLRDNLCYNKRLRWNRTKDWTFGKKNWKRTSRTETAPSTLCSGWKRTSTSRNRNLAC